MPVEAHLPLLSNFPLARLDSLFSLTLAEEILNRTIKFRVHQPVMGRWAKVADRFWTPRSSAVRAKWIANLESDNMPLSNWSVGQWIPPSDLLRSA
jgi:hypothetical protein